MAYAGPDPAAAAICGVVKGCERRADGTRVGFMTYERQWLVDLLHRLGYAQAANDAMRLPDHISEEQLQEFGNPTRDLPR